MKTLLYTQIREMLIKRGFNAPASNRIASGLVALFNDNIHFIQDEMKDIGEVLVELSKSQ